MAFILNSYVLCCRNQFRVMFGIVCIGWPPHEHSSFAGSGSPEGHLSNRKISLKWISLYLKFPECGFNKFHTYHSSDAKTCHIGPWFSLLAIWITNIPDSKVHGANMGPIWDRQDPGVPSVGPMNLVNRDTVVFTVSKVMTPISTYWAVHILSFTC